jgi:hypothetical protein
VPRGWSDHPVSSQCTAGVVVRCIPQMTVGWHMHGPIGVVNVWVSADEAPACAQRYLVHAPCTVHKPGCHSNGGPSTTVIMGSFWLPFARHALSTYVFAQTVVVQTSGDAEWHTSD